MRLIPLVLMFVATLAAQTSQPLPSAADVVARMIERDNQRQQEFHGYSSLRRYVLENSRHNKRAEMVVLVECSANGTKTFQTMSATGWGLARTHIFPKLLEGEAQASLPGVRERSRITPDNYTFAIVGMGDVDGRPAYIIEITPRTQNKYLVEARIWVDLEEYAILRIEGKPAKNPSFWVKSVQFVHTYQKAGALWLPQSDRSLTDARIVGSTRLTIEYLDYSSSATAMLHAREADLRSRP